jgi:magnesium-transporting ATPase (P-type)
MATGDNVLTAIHVGRECCIIKHKTDVLFGDLYYEGENEYILWKLAKSKEGQRKMSSDALPKGKGPGKE